MDHLLDGYARFRRNIWPERRRLFEALSTEGQKPHTLVIACADSRVDPTRIFDAGPGELFVVRNVANLVPPYAPDAAYHGTSAAIEYAVRVLDVPHIVVLGHAQCGGLHALLHGVPPNAGDFIAGWIEIAAPARARALACVRVEDRATVCEHATVALSLANLRGFPWIAERIADGRLALHGAHFGIADGRLAAMRADGTFAEVP